MTQSVLRDDRDGVAHLTLNRPDKLNALNLDVFQALEAHVKDIAGGAVRAVVLRGAGRCFSAGHDLGDIATGEKPPRPNYQSHVIEMLADLPMPVISAVHGHCYTGALELALAGDIILAAESAKFGDTHARWALTPVWGLSQRLPRRVGTYKAREMMFTCRTYSGRQALDMGLANACVADSEFDGAIAGADRGDNGQFIVQPRRQQAAADRDRRAAAARRPRARDLPQRRPRPRHGRTDRRLHRKAARK